MIIFLIGFMGSGKSTIGKKIAKQLAFNFVDLDLEIEKQENTSVSEIFESKGEDYFRQLETEWLKSFNDKNCIVSLGGGTPCFNNNMDIINKTGKSIYLKMNSGALTKRLVDSKTKRPLIEKYKHDESLLKREIEGLLQKREVFYSQADIVFEATNMSKSKLEDLKNLILTYV